MAKSAEFILEFESKQVLVSEPFGPSYEEPIQHLGEQPDLQVVECSSLKEMAGLARNVGVCVVLAHCPDESFAPGFVSMLQMLRAEIHERKIRVLITVSKDYFTLQPKFIREGASEVIPQPITPKQLYRKIDRFLNILPSRDSRGNIIPSQSRDKGSGADLSDEPKIVWSAPLKLKSDCWTTIEGKTCWLPGAGKWTVNLIGPPPQFGEWVPSERIGRPLESEEPTWEWVPSGLTDDPFIQDDGAWKYRGEKPEFKNGAWIFNGRHPELTFVQRGQGIGSKLVGDLRELKITEDSEQGHSAAEVIEKALRDEGNFAMEISVEPEADQPPVSDSPPEYLKMMPYEDRVEKTRPILTVNPLAAAFLVSEMILNRNIPTGRILWKLLEYLRLGCGGGQLELWLLRDGVWKCTQHDDLIDMALAQKLQAVRPERLCEEVVQTNAQRAVLIANGEERLGALVVAKGKADIFTDLEIKGFAKVMTGLLLGMKRDAA